jgi:hypothetical protein
MDFYSEFNDISKSNDKKAMIELLMDELASIIANRREDFLKVLDKSNIRYNPNATDTQLADIFINNINRNKKLLIGTGFLVAHKNINYGVDGDGKIPEGAVAGLSKTLNRCMSSKFSNLSGDPVSAIANAVSEMTKLGGSIYGQKSGADKERARQLLKQNLVDAKIQREAAERESSAKTKKIVVISFAVLGIAILGLIAAKTLKK